MSKKAKRSRLLSFLYCLWIVKLWIWGKTKEYVVKFLLFTYSATQITLRRKIILSSSTQLTPRTLKVCIIYLAFRRSIYSILNKFRKSCVFITSRSYSWVGYLLKVPTQGHVNFCSQSVRRIQTTSNLSEWVLGVTPTL